MMELRDWLAGVAAAALVGFAPSLVLPAAAQGAPRSLFEALPAPGAAPPVTSGLQQPTAAKPDKAKAETPGPRPAMAKAGSGQATKTASASNAPAAAKTPRLSVPLASASPQGGAEVAERTAENPGRGRKPRSGAKADARPLAAPPVPTASTAVPTAPAPGFEAPVADGRRLSRTERRKALREAREARKHPAAAKTDAEPAPLAQPAPTFASNPFMTLFGAVPAQSRGEPLPPVSGRPEIDRLVAYHAKLNQVPETLVHRVIVRESRYNPRAVGRGGAMGLMQIKTATARGVGYTGGPAGLLDAETNLTYGVKYLAGAWRVAGGSHDRAVSHYARGYYYETKRRGLAGLRRRGQPAPETAAAPPPAAPVFSLFTRQAAAQ